MPNPAWDGIARQIKASYRKAGGKALAPAAKDFMTFMQSRAAQAVYRKYGFQPAH